MNDSALRLKKLVDAGESISSEFVAQCLRDSSLVAELTTEQVSKPLAMVWRLIALSEIPCAETLPYTQALIARIYATMAMDCGFSLSGTKKQFLPCYNSMVISALCRLRRESDRQVQVGIDWMMEYQPLARGTAQELIDGISFARHGGCFQSTPCYIGVVKATHALLSYAIKQHDETVRIKADQGVAYILSHDLFKRKSSGKPITKHILDLSFPESYHSNIVDLLRLLALAQIESDPRTKDAISYVYSKAKTEDTWSLSFRYRADGYTLFDKGRQPAAWLSYSITQALNLLTMGASNISR